MVKEITMKKVTTRRTSQAVGTAMCAVALGATLLGPAALAAPGDNAGYSGPYCTPFEHADMCHQLP